MGLGFKEFVVGRLFVLPIINFSYLFINLAYFSSIFEDVDSMSMFLFYASRTITRVDWSESFVHVDHTSIIGRGQVLLFIFGILFQQFVYDWWH